MKVQIASVLPGAIFRPTCRRGIQPLADFSIDVVGEPVRYGRGPFLPYADGVALVSTPTHKGRWPTKVGHRFSGQAENFVVTSQSARKLRLWAGAGYCRDASTGDGR